MSLEDRTAIQDLVLKYCRGVDRKDRALLNSVYWDEAVDEHGVFNGPAREYVDWLIDEALKPLEITQHLISNHLIMIEGDTAEGESYFTAYHRIPTSKKQLELWVGGRYLDRYEKRDGEWRILHRKVATDWNGMGDSRTSWDDPNTENMAVGTGGPEDASHAFFKMLPVRES